jgi:outer membrane protein assembly factor BamB
MTRAAATLTLLACAAPLQAGQPHLIAVDSNRSLYEMNPATGFPTPIGTVSANAGATAALTVGPGNTVYLSSSSTASLYTLDLPTGAAALVGPYGDPAIIMHGIEYVPATDTLYGVSFHNGGFYSISRVTGTATLVGLTGLIGFANLGWNSRAGVLYMTSLDASGFTSLFTVQLATGAPTFVGRLNAANFPSALAYHPDNGNLYMLDNVIDALFTVDMATGAATGVGSTGTGNLLGLTYFNGPIPVELMGFTVE